MRTSQTIARLLSPKNDVEFSHEADTRRFSFAEVDDAQHSSHRPYIYTAPPHTRDHKRKSDEQSLSPLQSEQTHAAASSLASAATGALPSKDSPSVDPRFDESRWDNQFLAPLLPIQVMRIGPFYLLQFLMSCFQPEDSKWDDVFITWAKVTEQYSPAFVSSVLFPCQDSAQHTLFRIFQSTKMPPRYPSHQDASHPPIQPD